MDAITRNKRLRWIVVALIVMNVISLSVLWIGYSKRPGKRLDRGGQRFLEKTLGLSPEQIKSIQTLRKAHFEEMQSFQRDFHEARKRLHALSPSGNSTEAEDLARNIGELQTNMELSIHQHLNAIRDVCTEEQKAKFDEIREEMLRRGESRGGPGRGLPPPRGRGPGDGPPDGF